MNKFRCHTLLPIANTFGHVHTNLHELQASEPHTYCLKYSYHFHWYLLVYLGKCMCSPCMMLCSEGDFTESILTSNTILHKKGVLNRYQKGMSILTWSCHVSGQVLFVVICGDNMFGRDLYSRIAFNWDLTEVRKFSRKGNPRHFMYVGGLHTKGFIEQCFFMWMSFRLLITIHWGWCFTGVKI